jgi:hypothetical protein
VKINILSSSQQKDLNVNLDAVFDVRTINPISQNVNTKGIVFNVATIPDNAKQFFSQDGSLNLILYKQFAEPFISSSLEGVAKTISSTFRTADFKVYLITISFISDPNWEIISNSDLAKLVEWLNSRKANKENSIKSDKLSAQEAVASYFSNKNTADAWSSYAAAKTKEIERLKGLNTGLNGDIAKLQEDKKKAENDVLTKLNLLAAAKTAKKNNEDAIAMEIGKLNALADNLNSLLNSKNDKNSSMNDYSARANQNLLQIQIINEQYKEECSDKAASLTTAIDSSRNFKR